MKQINLVYPPFCSPASPPYSLAALKGIFKKYLNSEYCLTLFDTNSFYFNQKFKKAKTDFKTVTNVNKFNLIEYEQIISPYKKEFNLDQSIQHKKIIKNEKPYMFDEIILKITKNNPKLVAFSIFFSSQIPYTYALIKELKKKNIITVVGGPSMSHQLIKEADHYFTSYSQFIKFLNPEKKIETDCSDLVDFSYANSADYFSSEIVFPIKTSTTCFYRKCTFCTHHSNECYQEYDIQKIKISLIENKIKYAFLIDDMIPKGRLLKLSEVFKELNIKWMCQLKPTKIFDSDSLKKLYNNGLRLVIWGVESGSQRVLDKMQKGTKIEVINQVLTDSKKARISNATYIMFGFPTETKKEFIETLEFLKKNKNNIDLISSAVFGLQTKSYIYAHPEDFNIIDIQYRNRTLLDPAITYTITSGLTTTEAKTLRSNYKKTLRNLNSLPKSMNFFREHHLLYLN